MATPSIAENLRHLEMHITDYMHEHAVGTGDILYVQPKGFRFPYKATKETLDENMKYLEMMLEEFLHDHVTAPGANEEVLTDGGLESMSALEDTSGGTWQEVMKNGTFGRASLSTANPRNGTNHVRAELDELSANIYFGPNSVTDSTRTFPYLPVTVGDEVTFGAYAYIHSSQETPVFRLRATALEITSGEVTNSAGVVNVNKTPTEDMYGFVEETYTVTNPGFTVSGLYCWFQIGTTVNGNTARVDLDDFSILGPPAIDTLYTRDVGFRFPHPWEEDWAIKENVKHLEDQLSRWLHRHVEDSV